MAQRTISNRDNIQERNRVENRIWDAINRLENATAPAVIQQVVERDDRHFLAGRLVAGDRKRLVLGAGQPRGAARRAAS